MFPLRLPTGCCLMRAHWMGGNFPASTLAGWSCALGPAGEAARRPRARSADKDRVLHEWKGWDGALALLGESAALERTLPALSPEGLDLGREDGVSPRFCL